MYYVIKTTLYLSQNTDIHGKWAEVNANTTVSGICIWHIQFASTARLPSTCSARAMLSACCKETGSIGDSGISFLFGRRCLWTWMNFTKLEKAVLIFLLSKEAGRYFFKMKYRYRCGRKKGISKGVRKGTLQQYSCPTLAHEYFLLLSLEFWNNLPFHVFHIEDLKGQDTSSSCNSLVNAEL